MFKVIMHRSFAGAHWILGTRAPGLSCFHAHIRLPCNKSQSRLRNTDPRDRTDAIRACYAHVQYTNPLLQQRGYMRAEGIDCTARTTFPSYLHERVAVDGPLKSCDLYISMKSEFLS